jgi:hypothetical protein
MMKTWIIAVCSVSLGFAAELDTAGMGRDLNGWNDGLARFSVNGVDFQMSRPLAEGTPTGGLVIRAQVREIRQRAAVLEGTLRAEVSAAGTVEALRFSGKVDGRSFDTGEQLRPEPAAAPAEGEMPPVATESPVATEPPAPTESPATALRQSLLESFESAVERAKGSQKVVKRDLSSWLFATQASDPAQLRPGLDAILKSLFRRTR